LPRNQIRMNNQILIGSYAILQHYKDFRKCSDIDIATIDVKYSSTIKNQKIEFKPIPPLFKHHNEIDWSKGSVGVPSVDMLYTLKCSHLSWDIHWGKTAKDVIFLKSKGAYIIDELYEELYQYWETIHKSKKHINLNITNNEFFDNNVKYNQEHDKLHDKYKFYDRPLYELCKHNINKAILSQDIFNSWSKEKQLQLAIEEIKVIAEERFNFKTKQAIKHLILSMSRGWFNKFLINNLEELIELTI
jgi:hypothetical protein